jgi:hypothetical protein
VEPNASRLQVSLEPIASAVRSLLALCPIAQLEARAARLDVAPVGHRCRVAFDWLRAFVRRADPAVDRQALTIGIAYSDGRLNVSEVARLLRIPTMDAVAWLEEHGHCRSLEKFSLTDSERAAAFAALRRDRIHRGGRPDRSGRLVARDVAATQRIEDIDAREWLRDP